MIKVTFSQTATPATSDVNSVAAAIVNFLTVNGMDRDNAAGFVKVKDNRTIGFKLDCANNQYTTAIGLLLVVLGSAMGTKSAYVSFDTHNPDRYQMFLNIKDYTYKPYSAVCDWIAQHTNVEVTH
jgi:hypothetical protein